MNKYLVQDKGSTKQNDILSPFDLFLTLQFIIICFFVCFCFYFFSFCKKVKLDFSIGYYDFFQKGAQLFRMFRDAG